MAIQNTTTKTIIIPICTGPACSLNQKFNFFIITPILPLNVSTTTIQTKLEWLCIGHNYTNQRANFHLCGIVSRQTFLRQDILNILQRWNCSFIPLFSVPPFQIMAVAHHIIFHKIYHQMGSVGTLTKNTFPLVLKVIAETP